MGWDEGVGCNGGRGKERAVAKIWLPENLNL